MRCIGLTATLPPPPSRSHNKIYLDPPPYRSKTSPQSITRSTTSTFPSPSSNPLWNHLHYASFTFIVFPVLIDLVEVSIIKRQVQFLWSFIEELSFTLELVAFPHSLIRKLARLVIQRPIAVHFVSIPRTIIHDSILIIELPFAMSHIV